MKKSFSQNKTPKKNARGIAVIFTLGILGLLTVMALGFASTALLNRKIADNTSSAEYARHIARNIALARAKWAVMNVAQSNAIYAFMPNSYSELYSAENGPTTQDFLHKMDALLDGVEIYRETDDTGKIKGNTARWQYVYGPDKDPKSNQYPIIGRYAYAVVPDFGHMDPCVNIGSAADASNRYGRTEKELKLPGTNWNGLASVDLGNTRWKSFNEIMQTLSITAANTKKTFFNDGISIQQKPGPETFWLDLNKDGKRTPEEMFLRFNMTRDWAAVTVDQLIGEGVTDALTLANANGTQSNSFIPWLKYWNHSAGSSWTTEIMKKQIAANIIQYNLPGPDDTTPHKTISDKMGDTDDWLTAPPSYAGIGRHPMLNEIGFLIRVRTDVTADFVSKDDEAGTITYKYTPIYYITVDAGAELIYPFGPAPTSGMPDSEIRFSGTKSGDVNNMIMKFKLRKFLQDGSTELTTTVTNLGNNLIDDDGVLNSKMIHEHIDEMIIGSDGELTKLVTSSTNPVKMDDGAGLKWSNFNLSLKSADWNSSPMYTKANKFWKEEQTEKQQTLQIPIRSFTMTTNNSVGTVDQIATAIARRMTIQWEAFTPGNVVLKVSPKDSDAYVQRDVAVSLKTQTIPSNNYGKDYDNHDIIGWSGMDKDTEKVWFVAYETTDPLVNHYQTDWKDTPTGLLAWSETTSIKNDYPGTLYSSGTETATSHINSTVSGKLPNLTINGTTIQETATDPAYTSTKRLSTSYIRHGQMKSLWELAFISRAEAFRTLNLAKTKIFEPSPSAIGDLKAGSFANGDANILDQVKLSDSNTEDSLYKYGKINLNTKIHEAFSRLFRTDVNWYESLRTSDAADPFSTTATASSSVCSGTTCSSSTCLAHLLQARSAILPFSNRSDLLVEPVENDLNKLPGYKTDMKDKLISAQTALRDFLLKTSDTDTLCKAEKEQYAARFMNLFSTEPVERVYIIVVAQSIKDIGGAPAFVDWDGDGEYKESGTATLDANAKFLKTGFVRKKLYDSGYETITPSSGTAPALNETIASTAVGSYDYGADKITGETKLIVEMQKDILTNKWKIAGYRYVE